VVTDESVIQKPEDQVNDDVFDTVVAAVSTS
jgi:hypothetical protein